MLALLAGMLFWLLWPWLAGSERDAPALKWSNLAMLVLLQPLMEELLFRGLIQGKAVGLCVGQTPFGRLDTRQPYQFVTVHRTPFHKPPATVGDRGITAVAAIRLFP